MSCADEDPIVPLTPRPAATVMLIRDAQANPGGVEVFLMRRHPKMEFAAGVMVFPGGGVDDHDRDAQIVWSGPPSSWWAHRFGIETDLAEALVCAAARETFEECGVLFAGPAGDPGGIVDWAGRAAAYRESRLALANRTLSFADFLYRENLVLRADLLRPWAHWVTPEAERTRRYDTYFFVGALPDGQCADGENTESDRVGWTTPQAAVEDFAAGRAFLLPPTWTELNSLSGRSVADLLTAEQQIVPVQPHLAMKGSNWEFEFFDSDGYNQARTSGGSLGWPL
jgi:8-oxo-dGTP pyrophosphatase MutT (NUDIX family)